ncbi:MAG: hypothetical protein A3B86_01780 [Candidatus Yanofskybacteria bacterium RIFCSPHIGHO2_02_FULL_38_22b]|uniref:Uncharacterized protein n=1 Tax=Candidatus Yanofskybacteria bacterium RIFCSPHIGHO2_02_FULL_38_22b TaxID=1802673 RepID=A0A1F8F3E6_9BACT|nr:MAG: hypothetical protein A2816_00680 [Candidatus Yanofskybacteria bacterium RIFCSPHIGHO2_01_FULL_39_44]OGN07120.1 MAG: hypothetical protein A3B86_01780 [Candidatus Yanofskybacteria bacterium RIFCSPHIGHO2_02_FULL_38_22b]OGN19970.1 MAG: hypothetical protein A2910_00490 [Candidatus Yanofskybacteria bacterium RIFCSPLOWO2_01_FULL_39_28]
MSSEQPKIDQEDLKEEIKFKIEMIQRRIHALSDIGEKFDDPALEVEQDRLVLDANLEITGLQKLLASIMEDIKKREY